MVLGALVIVIVGILVVNYFRDRGIGKISEIATQNQAGEVKTHKVAKGENLWVIAEKYYGSGYNWVDIAEENNLKDAGVISADQELVIPNVEPKKLTVEEVETAEPIDGATYEVVKGDNLWTIAVRAYGDGYKWTQIAQENSLANPNLIHPGNILVLPR